MVTLPIRATSGPLPKSGPFPPPALPGFDGTMSLSDSLRDRLRPSRASRWCFMGCHHAGSLVLLGKSPCCVLSPLPRWDQAEASLFARTLAVAFRYRTERRLPRLAFSGLARCSHALKRLLSAVLRPASSLSGSTALCHRGLPTASLPPPTPRLLLARTTELPGGSRTHGIHQTLPRRTPEAQAKGEPSIASIGNEGHFTLRLRFGLTKSRTCGENYETAPEFA